MDHATFQRNFPADVPVPDRLRQLLEFQNRRREWYAGHFELDSFPFGDVALFDGDEDAAGQFVVFGREPDCSLYAFWLYPSRQPGMPPVVFLGADGTDGLIANDLNEFLALLGLGATNLGHAIVTGAPLTPDEPAPRLQEFREWLKNFGIVRPRDPLSTVWAARRCHPDLGAWMKNWRKTQEAYSV